MIPRVPTELRSLRTEFIPVTLADGNEEKSKGHRRTYVFTINKPEEKGGLLETRCGLIILLSLWPRNSAEHEALQVRKV